MGDLGGRWGEKKKGAKWQVGWKNAEVVKVATTIENVVVEQGMRFVIAMQSSLLSLGFEADRCPLFPQCSA